MIYSRPGVELHHGEALRFLLDQPADTYDAVITDPPYSSGGLMRADRTPDPRLKYQITYGPDDYARKDELPTFGGDNRDQRSFVFWCQLWLSEALRVTRPGGLLIVWTDWRQLPSLSDAIQAGGWVWRGIIPWDKTTACRPVLGRPRNQCEYALWASAGPLPPPRPGEGTYPGLHRARIPRGKERRHLTGKNPDVMAELARLTVPGARILDPFIGGGSTAIGALRAGEGRSCVGVDQSPAILAAAAEWYEEELHATR